MRIPPVSPSLRESTSSVALLQHRSHITPTSTVFPGSSQFDASINEALRTTNNDRATHRNFRPNEHLKKDTTSPKGSRVTSPNIMPRRPPHLGRWPHSVTPHESIYTNADHHRTTQTSYQKAISEQATSPQRSSNPPGLEPPQTTGNLPEKEPIRRNWALSFPQKAPQSPSKFVRQYDKTVPPGTSLPQANNFLSSTKPISIPVGRHPLGFHKASCSLNPTQRLEHHLPKTSIGSTDSSTPPFINEPAPCIDWNLDHQQSTILAPPLGISHSIVSPPAADVHSKPVCHPSSPPAPIALKSSVNRSLSQSTLPLEAKTPTPHDACLGDDPTVKASSTYRFAFNNCNGISLTPSSLNFFVTTAKHLQLDWLGLAETHLDTAKSHVRSQVKNAFQSIHGYSMANCAFSTSTLNFGSDWKPGGTCQIATDNLATRTVSTFSDKYGRFTAQTHTGCNGRRLTTILGYCVLDSCRGPSSAFSQQRAMLVADKRPAHPRQMFHQDLTAFIQNCQQEGSEILLCLDANETWHKSTSRINCILCYAD